MPWKALGDERIQLGDERIQNMAYALIGCNIVQSMKYKHGGMNRKAFLDVYIKPKWHVWNLNKRVIWINIGDPFPK